MRNTTFSRLAVDANHFLIRATNVRGINRQIGHIPGGIFFTFRQALVYRILVASRKRGENQLAGVRMARVHRQLRAFSGDGTDLIHARKIKLGIYALAVEIHRHGHNVHIACPLTVAEQSALDTVRARHDAKLCCRYCAAAVVVGMQRNNQRITVLDMVTEPLNLICIDIGRTHLNRCRQINDDWLFRSGCQDFVNGIAHRDGKIQLGPGKALRAVLKDPLRVRTGIRRLFDKTGSIDSDIPNAVTIEAEHKLPLHGRGTVVEVNHRALDSLERGKRFLNQVWPGLRQHLNGHALRNPVLLNQFSQKRKVVTRSRREAHFDLGEAD